MAVTIEQACSSTARISGRRTLSSPPITQVV
jgi:hypothetical protein